MMVRPANRPGVDYLSGPTRDLVSFHAISCVRNGGRNDVHIGHYGALVNFPLDLLMTFCWFAAKGNDLSLYLYVRIHHTLYTAHHSKRSLGCPLYRRMYVTLSCDGCTDRMVGASW